MDVDAPFFDIGENRARLLRDGEQALVAMLDAIATAEREVVLEMYWIGDDIVGRTFVDALANAAGRGIDVRVVFDAVGSLSIGLPFFLPILRRGGRVREYHALSPFNLNVLEMRDHRKLLVTDGRRAFTGGVNLAKQWAPIWAGGDGWRDDMIEVRGPIASELRAFFYGTWRRITRHRNPEDLVRITRSPKKDPVTILSSRRRKRQIQRAYVRRIRLATKTVEIANPYFVPNFRVMRALIAARRHGVRVRILLPDRLDVPIIRFAQNGLVGRLLAEGVQIYALKGPMMHQKTAIIDDTWVTIGSYNLDERSYTKNLELNVAVEDRAFATHVREVFDRDIANATRIDPHDFDQRGLAVRAAEKVALAFRRLM